MYADTINDNVSILWETNRFRTFAIQHAAARKLLKRNRSNWRIDFPVDQDHRQPRNRFREQIPAVDQRVKPIRIRLKTDDQLGVQRSLPPDRQHAADNARQTGCSECRQKRSAHRYGTDHCSVRVNGSTELQRQQHCRAADQRRGKQQKRKCFPDRTGAPKQGGRKSYEARKLPVRRLQNRKKE